MVKEMKKLFLTRVELYGSHHTSAEYTKLHEALAKMNIIRSIDGSDGKNYHLPPAEYYCHSETLNAQQIKDLVMTACKAIGYAAWYPGCSTVGKWCGIITAESPSLAWAGLKAA